MPLHTDVLDNERNPADIDPISADAPLNFPPSPEVVNVGAPSAVPADVATDQHKEAAAASLERDPSELRAQYFRQLCENITSYTAPLVLLGKWGFLCAKDTWRRIDMAPSEFVAALEQDYSVESLTELGLYELVDDKPQLPSWLDLAAHLYVEIDEHNRTLRFSRGDEFLFPMTRTALDYALERIPPDSTQAPVTLFVADTQDSVEVLQRLGLRAVNGEGLEVLSCDQVRELFSGDQRSDYGWRYYLLLVDFNATLLENQPTAAIGDVIQRLADAADVYGVDPARRFGVCRPCPDELQALEGAVSFADSAKICQLFEEWSAAAKSARIHSWRTHFNPAGPSFSVASAALTRTLQTSNGFARPDKVLAALPAYRAAGREAVLQKFHLAIDRTSDPFDQVDLMAAAGYAETFFNSDPLVRAAEAVLAGKTLPSARELQEECFDHRQQCIVELRRIRRDKAKR